MNKSLLFPLISVVACLTGCTPLTTLTQGVANASPPATAPQVLLVCRSALCAQGNPPTSATVNSAGNYEVLGNPPFNFFVQASHPQFLTLAVSVDGTTLSRVYTGSLSQCHPNGCFILNSTDKTGTNGQTQTFENVLIVLPDSLVWRETDTVTLTAQSLNPQYTGTAQASASTSVTVGSFAPARPQLSVGWQPGPSGQGYALVFHVFSYGPDIDGYQVYAHDQNPNSVVDSVNIAPNAVRDSTFTAVYDANIRNGLSQTFYVRTSNQTGTSPFSYAAEASVPAMPSSGGTGSTSTPKTCSGANATSAAANLTVTGEDQDKCGAQIPEYANNQGEAQMCAQRQYPAFTPGNLSPAYLAIYEPDGEGGYICTTSSNFYQINSGDAQTCASNTTYQGDTVVDITSAVLMNGQADLSVLDNYCSAHPTP